MNQKPTYEALEQRIKTLEQEASGRRQAEQALRRSEQFLQEVFEAIQDGISVLDTQLNVLKINRWMEKRYARFLPLAGQKCYQLYHDRSSPCPWCPTLRTLSSGEVTSSIIPHPTAENPLNWIELSIFPIKDEKGRVTRVIEHVKDVTQRIRVEQALRENEKRLAVFFDQAADAIFISRLDGRLVQVNQQACRSTGYTREELLGMNVFDIDAETSTPEAFAAFTRTLSRQGRVSVESRHRRKDGSVFPAEITVTLLEIPGGTQVFGIARDITERKRNADEQRQLQEKLYQSQKFEAIGTLAGGIAHDFNNLLMGIQGRQSLVMLDLDASHPHYEHLKGIETYVKSATDLTRQLLGFARGGKYEVTPIDLNQLVLDSAAMFGRTKKEIRIHTKTPSSPLVVEADRRQIEQVLLNLYVNAWQAMPDGGNLYLETKMVGLDDAYCRLYDAKPGRYARISVADTGIGMDDAVRQRIFDPFFTTKEKGRGTGLGLASAYGIIKNHAGIINVYSEVGQGSTFNIYLPLSEKAALREAAREPGIVNGSETILLVDDEEMVIEVGRALLKKLGYRVLIARSGPAALEILKSAGEEIHLVILDLIMPEMGGGKTFDLIRRMKPALPVMLASGYAINGQATEIMQRGCNGFIQKPFSVAELSQKIRAILDDV